MTMTFSLVITERKTLYLGSIQKILIAPTHFKCLFFSFFVEFKTVGSYLIDSVVLKTLFNIPYTQLIDSFQSI